MIALDNFESCVPYRILVRGEEYYETGAVSELEEDSPGEWTATAAQALSGCNGMVFSCRKDLN